MAEIHIERKRTTNIWPWIIGLILAALLIWALYAVMDRDNGAVDDTASVSQLFDGQLPAAALLRAA